MNRNWVDLEPFEDLELIDVAPEEPGAANVLTIGDTALVPQAYPQTAAVVARLGWRVRRLDISELQKAEAGLTCSSILFDVEDS